MACLVLAMPRQKSKIQYADLFSESLELTGQAEYGRAGGIGQPGILTRVQFCDQTHGPSRPLGSDDAELAQMAAYGIEQHGALTDQKIAAAVYGQDALLFGALNRHKAHGGPGDGFANGFGIGSIVLAALDVGLHIGRRHETDLVAKQLDLAGPVVGGGTGLHANQAGWQGLQETEHRATAQLLAKSDIAIRVDAVKLKNSLRQIQTNGAHFLGDPDDLGLPAIARSALLALGAQLFNLAAAIGNIERQLMAWHRQNVASRRLETIPGIGIITATALAASVPDPSVFGSGRQFAAWLGLVPRQSSSGGKDRLGHVSKMGNGYLRRLLVVGATSVTRRAAAINTRTGAWVRSLLERKPARLVTVAIANKTARTAWALLAREESYRAIPAR